MSRKKQAKRQKRIPQYNIKKYFRKCLENTRGKNLTNRPAYDDYP